MSECMPIPDNWKDFVKEYSFKDIREIYTNGSWLIPTFRVEQMMEHFAKPEWISVKDRLPEENDFYLVYIVANSCPKNRQIITLYFSNLSKRFIYGSDEIFTVTHWMSLPQKPESESDAE